MTHPNKQKGNDYERRFLKERLKKGATRAVRHYGSLGITDVEWTDKNGYQHEAQLKFSSKHMPYIRFKEECKLKQYALEKKGVKVWLVMKQSRKKEVWRALN